MKKYQIIYADPPWRYRDKMVMRGVHGFIRGSESFYKTMSTEEIMKLPISTIADKNSVLFLWITVPLIQEGFKVLEAWGYKYKTMLFWKKYMTLGMGHWFRGQVEILLFAIKGKVKAFRIQHANIIQAKVREHSRKPDEFYDLIEMTRLNPKIELFARPLSPKREGWDCIGNEINGKDIRQELEEMIKE